MILLAEMLCLPFMGRESLCFHYIYSLLVSPEKWWTQDSPHPKFFSFLSQHYKSCVMATKQLSLCSGIRLCGVWNSLCKPFCITVHMGPNAWLYFVESLHGYHRTIHYCKLQYWQLGTPLLSYSLFCITIGFFITGPWLWVATVHKI